MSEISEGPDWWQASDGKWYPPQSHPDYIAPRPETEPEATPPASPASRYLWTTTPTTVPPTGPAPVAAPPDAPAPMTPPPSTDWVPPTETAVAATDASGPAPSPATKGTPSKTPWVIGVGVLLALAVAAVVVALAAGSGSGSGSTLPTGPSTATINVTIPRTGQPSFSGTVAGRALTGKVVATSSSSSSFENGGTLATYEGNLAGTAYVLHVSISLPSSPSSLQGFAFKVTGTYGSEPVTATASFSALTSNQQAGLAITGHVGTQEITGVARVGPSNDGSVAVTATFSVVS